MKSYFYFCQSNDITLGYKQDRIIIGRNDVMVKKCIIYDYDMVTIIRKYHFMVLTFIDKHKSLGNTQPAWFKVSMLNQL